MSSEAADASGTWRKGEHVLIGDVLAPVQSSLVWLALVMIAFITGLPALIQAGLVQNSPSTGVRLLREPWILQLLTITADLVLLFYLWRIARRVSEAALIARFRSVRRTLLLLAMLGGAALAVGTIFGSAWLVAQKLIVFHPVPGESLITPGPPWQILVSFLAVGIVAPLVEEFYFRGILLSWIARKATVYAAIPASALVFALLPIPASRAGISPASSRSSASSTASSQSSPARFGYRSCSTPATTRRCSAWPSCRSFFAERARLDG
jgi:membrane protease YdiL (CAAX protease family)